MSRITDAVLAVSDAVISQRDYLTDLDREIGDADHGINMARGFSAVQDALDDIEEDDDLAAVLALIGDTLLENVGGAAGFLYGTAFRYAAEAAEKKMPLTIANIGKLLDAAVRGIEARGRAERGDKTILDSLIPIAEAFHPENTEDKRLYDVMQDALRAGREGVNYTKTIAAKKGRASFIGERSIGHEDPGAVSTLIMFRAFYQYLKTNHIVCPLI